MSHNDSTAGTGQPSPAIDLRHSTPPTTVYAGQRALRALGRELERADLGRVLVVVTPALHETAPFDAVLHALGDRITAVFSGVRRYSPTSVVRGLAEVITRERVDAVVVVGGGSAMVTTRAAVAISGEGRPLEELLTRRDESGRVVNPTMPRPKLPIWIVPSTPTPAMAKAGAALRDDLTGERVAVFDPKTRAAGIVFDPAVASSSPSSLFVETALNALSMGAEGLLATRDDPFAEALLAQGVREVVTHLSAVAADASAWDPRARVMMGAVLAGQGTDYSGAGLALALSHELAPHAGAAGGVVETILLPHTIRFTAEAVPDRVPVLARALGAPGGTLDAIEENLRGFTDGLGIPGRLSSLSIARGTVEHAVEHAVSDWAMNARMPRRADLEDLRRITSAAW